MRILLASAATVVALGLAVSPDGGLYVSLGGTGPGAPARSSASTPSGSYRRPAAASLASRAQEARLAAHPSALTGRHAGGLAELE